MAAIFMVGKAFHQWETGQTRADGAGSGGPGSCGPDDVQEVLQQGGAVSAHPGDSEFHGRDVFDLPVSHAVELEGPHPGRHDGHAAAGGHECQHRGGLAHNLGDARLEAGLAAQVRAVMR
jgi:hypothetical protein